MICGDCFYIWQSKDWPDWQFDLAAVAGPLAEVSLLQGRLLGRLAGVGLSLQKQADLEILTNEVVKSCEIEGVRLDIQSVRSSIALKLGVDIGALAPSDKYTDGVVDMVLDATSNYMEALTLERLLGWHRALFPSGYSGMFKITVGAFRKDVTGPMQVVSGPVGRQRVHFEAPPAERLEVEIQQFLDWVNSEQGLHPLIKAGLGHLWFVTLHPFEDGNGRIARAIGDMLLARADNSPHRFYSLSSQIQRERKSYYDILESTQKGSMDVTNWLFWFLDTLNKAIAGAFADLESVLTKARFWQHWALVSPRLNARQIKMLNMLLEGFKGKLTTSKWAIINKCSQDTALRDINDLVSLGILQISKEKGRSTSYLLAELP
jgi:Fic family protein